MKRLLAPLALAAILIATSVTVRADSLPVIEGAVSGIELCQQSVCGAAVFLGVFTGQVGGNPHAIGAIAAGITHDDLPAQGETADITGGLWQLRLLSGRTFSGFVAGGELSNPFDDNTFGVTATLVLVRGGTGSVTVTGVLDHTVFPPAIVVALSQE
jgi:hypothetical protein